MTDLRLLIAHHSDAASEPHTLPTPAVPPELAVIHHYRRLAQVRFDASPVWARKVAA